jgi:hypothetical protein
MRETEIAENEAPCTFTHRFSAAHFGLHLHFS